MYIPKGVSPVLVLASRSAPCCTSTSRIDSCKYTQYQLITNKKKTSKALFSLTIFIHSTKGCLYLYVFIYRLYFLEQSDIFEHANKLVSRRH